MKVWWRILGRFHRRRAARLRRAAAECPSAGQAFHYVERATSAALLSEKYFQRVKEG